MDKPDVRSVESAMRGRLSARLFDHSREVAAYAAHLAKLHACDAEWAYLAGLYHDLGKSFDLAAMRSAATAEAVAFDEMESVSPSLMHAAASAAVFRRELHPPEPFVRAVRGHTLGSVPSGKEEMILYIADFAEPTRPYEECESVRKTAERDLGLAALETVAFKIRFLMLRSKSIHPRSVDMYNYLLGLRRGSTSSDTRRSPEKAGDDRGEE